MSKLLRMGLRGAWRDWRSGEMRLLALALVVAVAALSAVGFFTDRLERAMGLQAAELLGADLVVSAPVPIRVTLRARAAQLGLELAETVDFPSVVLSGDRTTLVQVKAVGRGYPLRGRLQISDERLGPGRETRSLPAPGTVWVESRLLDLVGLVPGASIALGDADLSISRILRHEPDRGGQLFRLAPRVLLSMGDLETTGLLTPTSRARYRLLLAGPPEAVASYRRWLDRHRSPQETVADVDSARPEVRTALEQARRYLGLAALVAVLVAGAAVSLSARHYAARQLDAVALMRCLGASRGRVLCLFGLRLLCVGLLAGLVGLAAGFLAQLGLAGLLRGWFLEALPAPGPAPVLTGLFTAVLTLMGFALPPIQRLAEVPPLRVMRGELGPAPPSAWVTGVAAGLALFLLLAWQTRETEASLKILVGAMGLVGVLWALGAVSIALLRHGPWRGTWRWAVKRLCDPGNHAVLQLCGLAVGITALLVLGVLRVELVERWRTSLPERSPNHFLIGIQMDEGPELDALFSRHGLEAPVYHPIVRGRLVAINDRAVEPEHYEGLRARRLAAREFNLTWARRLATDNRVVAGRWWEETPGVGFSVEEGIARTLGIRLGDRPSFLIAGAKLSAPVTSLREVDWESFRPNFFVIASPGLLSGAPASLMTAFYLDPEQQGFIAELARGFPGVTDIDVDMVLRQVRGIMDRAALAIEYVFGFTLLAGAVVMFAAIEVGLAGRRREIALKRALGASRGRILKGLTVEFALLGALAGALSALMASIAGHWITTQVFELSALPSPWLWLWGIAGAVTGVVTVGIVGTRRLLDQPPWPILQQANG